MGLGGSRVVSERVQVQADGELVGFLSSSLVGRAGEG